MRYIHIGTLKTGSTAIQSFMEANAAALSAQGILYPNAARHGRHKHLYLKQELRRSNGAGGENWAALHAELGAHPHPKVLLSDEGFALLDSADVAHFHRLLGPGENTVIVYFRDYASWLPSLYAEYTKNGRNLDDFDTYFDRVMGEPGQARVITAWAEAFGWANIRVRQFAPDRLVNGDAVDDLLHLLGTNRATVGAAASEPVRAAPSWQALEIARAVLSGVASMEGGTVDERIPLFVRSACMEAAVDAAPVGGAKAEYLSAAQRERCNQRTVEELTWLNQQLPDASLVVPPSRPLSERPFMPSIAQVPSSTVAAAMSKLAVLLAAQVPDGKVERKRRTDRKNAVATRASEMKGSRRERDPSLKPAGAAEAKAERKARKAARRAAA